MLTSIHTRTYIHIVTRLLIFSVLPSSSPISVFLSPSASACLGSKQVLQQAKHCATPQRLSVTFSVLGSISPVIIGCLFYCGSTTIAAVSLQQGLLLLMPIENRKGHFVGPQMAPVFLMRCIDWASDSEHSRVVCEGCWEVCGHMESRLHYVFFPNLCWS